MRVLYVGHDHDVPEDYCVGSVLCLSCVRNLTSVQIRVQDTAILRQHATLPPWLDGTPILIDDEEGEPLRGTAAYRALQALVSEERLAKRRQAPAASAHHDAGGGAPPPRLQPMASRQTGPAEPEPFAAPAHRADAPPPPLLDGESDGELEQGQDATDNGRATSVPSSNEKITEDVLQRFMEQRKASPASAVQPASR